MGKNNSNPKILNFCIDIFSIFLSSDCSFLIERENNEEISYSLTDESFSSMDDKNGNPIRVAMMENKYWLGCSFSFYRRPNNKKDLKQLCLHFFDEESQLFRVDWSCLEIKESKDHAQPHWHFDREASIIKQKAESYFLSSYADFQKENDYNNESLKVDLERFHFFMTLDVEKDKNNTPPYLDFRNESVLKNWLTKTMTYIDTELKALAKR